MPQFAANLHYLFSELPFLDRFEAAAVAGFKAVEFQVPYDYPAAELTARLRSNALQMVLFDAPMGDWERGERGLAAVPGRQKEFRNSLAKVIEYGGALGCHTVHLMAGVVGPGEDTRPPSARIFRILAWHWKGILRRPSAKTLGCSGTCR